MFRYFTFIFIALAALEIFVLIEVGGLIGGPLTVAFIILTGVIGVNLLKRQGMSVMSNFQEKLQTGQMPQTELVEGIMLAFAGGFLVTPGFITDIIGFILVIEPMRQAIARYLIKHSSIATFQQTHGDKPFTSSDKPFGAETTKPNQTSKDSQIIEGEFERKDE